MENIVLELIEGNPMTMEELKETYIRWVSAPADPEGPSEPPF